MSRNRNRPTQQPATKPEDAPEQPQAAEPEAVKPETVLLWPDEHLRPATSRTRAELAMREALWSHYGRVHAMVKSFVAEKVAEGFSIDEVLELYELVSPLAPRLHVDGDRVRVELDVQIVERVEREEGGE